jgi:hypothetical protein
MNKGTKPGIITAVIGIVIIIGFGIGFAAHSKSHSKVNNSEGSSTSPGSGSSTTGSATPRSSIGSSTGSGTGGSSTGSATPATNVSSCYSASQAAGEEGQSGCVQFTGYQYTSSRGSMYLDQSTSAPYGFSAYIPAGSSFGPSLLNEYSGKLVDVTGSITSYDGEPEIVVSNASQVTLAQ